MRRFAWVSLVVGAVLFSLNLAVPLMGAEEKQGHLLVQEILDKKSLEIVQYPDPFNFAPVVVSNENQYRFHTAINTDADTSLVVRDKRNSGGFKVFLDLEPIEATHKVKGGGQVVKLDEKERIGDENMYVVTSSDDGEAVGGVSYLDGFVGEKNILAPLDASGGDLTSFDTFEAKGKSLNSTPILILDGTLPIGQGRSGDISVDVNYALKIKRFQPPGSYRTNFIYTIQPS